MKDAVGKWGLTLLLLNENRGIANCLLGLGLGSSLLGLLLQSQQSIPQCPDRLSFALTEHPARQTALITADTDCRSVSGLAAVERLIRVQHRQLTIADDEHLEKAAGF